ncbi:MAG TPA: GTP cyclohydrolase [Methylomirabilota bacterium]|nr:GTP cyclohydrolase [Methylomirabilota bacterium]
MIVRLAEGLLETKFGTFLEVLYYDGQNEYMALIMGQVENTENVLCRIHSECISAHIFNSIECDCREQMEMSQLLIEQAGLGIVIWLPQEGRGNGHLALLASSKLKAEGLSQTEAYIKLGYEIDTRSYKRAAEILRDLKLRSIILLTNNPRKTLDMQEAGIKVSGTKQLFLENVDNRLLLQSYIDKIKRGHLINLKME